MKFEKAVIEVININVADIITESPGGEPACPLKIAGECPLDGLV